MTPMVTRRRMLGSAGAAAAAMLAPRVARATDRKPNLLYILADDHAGYVLGAQGNRRAYTPNLDRLASEGTRFARNYCNSPVCTASRQSFLTSQLPHSSGVTLLGTPLAEDKPTLARQLAASGYEPAVFGKMHFNTPGRPGLHGFVTVETEDMVARDWGAAAGPPRQFNGIRTKPKWRPFEVPASIWLDSDTLPEGYKYENMESTWVMHKAVNYMREHKDEPFALWVSFREPHSPFNFPIEDRNDFNPAEFPVPEVGPEDAEQIPLVFRGLTPEQKQGIIAAYYTSVRYLDRNVGAVLAALRALGLENETLVIYMADHGYSLGQHGRFEKHVCYDPALRVPLIMRWPGHIRAGGVVEDFTESVDVPPTLLEMLGAEPFQLNQGQSLAGYLRTGKVAEPRQSIFSEYLENEEACIRTDRWKFIYCSGKRFRLDGYMTGNLPRQTIQLFDLQKDPGEFMNVADQHPEAVQQFSKQMLEIFRATHPQASEEPSGKTLNALLDWYLRPRDAHLWGMPYAFFPKS